jgi:hypothetical protein
MKHLLKYGISNQTINELTTVNSRIKHFLCWLVTIALILNALGTYAPWIFASNSTTLENPIVDSEDSKYADYGSTTDQTFDQSEIAIEKEMVNERTLNTKTFRRIDGSYVVAYYPEVIHYEKDGALEEIDNTFVYNQSNGYCTNKSNAFQIMLPSTLSESNTFSISNKNYRIEWNVIDSNSSSMQYEPITKSSTNLLELKNVTQEAKYTGVSSFYDLQYKLTGQKLKENIILNRFVENNSISFNYKTTKPYLKHDENENIVFEDEKGNIVFAFENLFMIDAMATFQLIFNLVLLRKQKMSFNSQSP